jgi:hypothetical protein
LARYIYIVNGIVLTISTKPRSPNYLSTLRIVIDAAKYEPLNTPNRTLPAGFTIRKVGPISVIALKEYLTITTRATLSVRLYFAIISTLLTLLPQTKRIPVLEENIPSYITRNTIGT